VGTVLGGKYRIERVLGTGGIAVVAAAYHLQLQCTVAIKYLLAEALEYPEIVERFSREARAAARIRGEHVARVIDVGVFDDGAPYIVLEYLEGVDLEQLVRQRGPLPVAEAVRYVLQACEAIAEAHAANIVHRDLKPANLFLAKGPDRRRKVKVLDFGVSKILDEPMTDPARILGTVVYMPPEQLHTSSDVGPSADIWSLGVILYELLAGKPPFTGRTVVTIARRIGVNTPEPLGEIRRDVPKRLEAVIQRCMRSNPDERPASVLELAVALAPFAESRDRDSVRAINVVLNGSLAPPAPVAESGAINVLVPPIPKASPTPVPVALGPVPPPATSDAPMTTPVSETRAPSIASEGMSRFASGRTWIIAAALVVVVAFTTRMLLSSPPPPASAAARQGGEIALKVTTTVPDARIRVDDGATQLMPVDVRVPRDGREHTLRVEADGYVPRSKTVTFDSDLHLVIALTHTEAPTK
jgi:serine/threonine-protein kinase